MGQQGNDDQLDPQSVLVVGEALVVRPGDRLILGVTGPLTQQQADRIKTHLREQLPGLADAVLITNVSHLAVYRTENADA